MVPNSISSISLILGILAIFLAFEKNYEQSSIFIVLAMCADSLDGRAARLLGVSGEFGKELDSLCDLCSFGVAPAILIYMYGLSDLGLVGKIIAALYTVGGAMRLARFNVDASVVKGCFIGMPIPAGACVISAYVFSGLALSPTIVACGTLVLAYILYSNIKFPDFKGKGNPIAMPPAILAIIIGAVLLYLQPFAWAFILMVTYSLVGIINHFYQLAFR
jgi:CDP-diacylglycerol--serine O-phosphatidyltransferase